MTPDDDRADLLAVPFRSVLGEVMLMLIRGGRRSLEEHPEELASDPDELDVIAAGCQYLRDHPEARVELGRRASGGQRG